MEYRSIEQLNRDARELATELPTDIELIAGMPRSGMFPAELIAWHLNLPITDVDGIIEDRILGTGPRGEGNLSTIQEVNKVLVVDDSVSSGSQMMSVKNELSDVYPEVEFSAIYVSEIGKKYVDYYSDIVRNPRVFEWNIMHHGQLRNSCVEVEGVLCDGSNKVESKTELQKSIPEMDIKVKPSKKIGRIITSWPNSVREETEKWLFDNGIKYSELVMSDGFDKGKTITNNIEFKSKEYNNSNFDLYISGSYHDSVEIVKRTNKPVFCYDTSQMINASESKKRIHQCNIFINSATDRYIGKFASITQSLLTRSNHLIRNKF